MICRTYYEVSCLVKLGVRQGKSPDKPDICDYTDDEIIEIIPTPMIINNRNVMRVPEVEKHWGGM